MVKAKRGKKPVKDGSDDSDIDQVDDLTENVDNLSLKSGGAKTKQKKKPVQRAGFELLLAGESGEESASSDDGEDSGAKPANKSKSKKTQEEEDEDSDEAPKSSKAKGGKKSKKQATQEADSDNSDVEIKTEAKGGKKSKRKKKKDESDEDIEKILAELQMEYTGVKSGSAEPEETKGKKKSEAKETPEEESKINEEADAEGDERADTGSTIKSAAQKKREKKEREKLKKMQQKQVGGKSAEAESAEPKPTAAASADNKAPAAPVEAEEQKPADEPEGEKDEGGKKKKGKKGAAVAAVEVKEEKKAPKKNKMIAAIQEAQKKIQEEEERLRREEDEEEKRLEALDQARQEQERLEQERKERKKKKEKERKERLKAEGKLLTPKQRADRARAQAMLEALGVAPPPAGEKKVRPGTRIRPNKMKQQAQQQTEDEAASAESRESSQTPSTEAMPQETAVEEPVEEVKDAWDAESESDAEGSEAVSASAEVSSESAPTPAAPVEAKAAAKENSSEEEDEEDSDSESSDDSDENMEHLTDQEKKRAKAKNRIVKRREEAEKKRSADNLRAAVICVLGHVDTGKTKILDKLRRTSVQAGEAGGITQQIGATNVPMDAIKEQTKIVKGFAEIELKLPGLLIIDTPGHASFSNLRSRGSSLCDMAILVVDIMHGLEEQTLESINLLKTKKTPFIVALNKIDRLYDWSTMSRKDIRDVIKSQATNTQTEFDKRTKDVILQFAEQGLNAALFYDNPDPRSYVSLVPTSAITGEGMGNLLALIVENCQNMLYRRLMYSEELQATVLEVKAITGLGTTIDCILVNGRLREGETIVLASSDGNAIVTQIRSLLMPQPMKELRVKNEYIEYKEIQAAQGVKIAAKDLEKAIAGLNMLVAHHPDEVDICREEVVKDLARELGRIKLQQTGVLVQASTLGSLEALLEFLKDSKIPYSSVKIGPVVKKDVMRASSMLERDSQFGTILAFDVKIERDAQEMADSLGVKIFTADIIYHLFDQFTKHREDLRQSKRQQFKNIAVFPCKLRILPQYVFNSRDPIVAGVIVEDGIVCIGTPICVPNKEANESAHFVDIGVVTSIESNHKSVENARRGQEVCVKIEPTGDGAPKMYGRHFDEKDFLLSKISRQSIDACKEYFREDLLKTDWQLMVELKKIFQIL